ncbi:NYN domain-containing protein [Massilia sp. PWRC2]|uniref:NYN domain-containing protein n=1 Tax=Massilia sp. PWRC2 TaxID=2804626 RepID=UPI003CF07CF5
MASTPDNISMAVFCDFENVALGVRDANYEKFDIKPVLERLLLKGSIVVKKAYCDWERYKGFKATMHEANFELIEIPHVRQSGKNSADIRLVVDALDLCYTKSHVNTFVIISGDSDFSPLVSKLRENNKQVIGVGVKQSTSDLLVANCDEFIFYDDLVREVKRAAAKRDERKSQPQASTSGSNRRAPDDKNDKRKEELEARKAQAIDMVVEMFDALVSERGDSGKIWASLLKDTLKRRRPEFNETYFGFRTFGNLLEEAQARGLLEFGRDEKSGAYVYRSAAGQAGRSAEAVVEDVDGEAVDGHLDGRPAVLDIDGFSPEMAELLNAPVAPMTEAPAAVEAPRRQARPEQERGRGRGRGRTDFRAPVAPQVEPADLVDAVEPQAEVQPEVQPEPAVAEQVEALDSEVWNDESPFPPPAAGQRRAPARKPAAKKARAPAVRQQAAPEVVSQVDVLAAAPVVEAAAKPVRSRRPAKAKVKAEQG